MLNLNQSIRITVTMPFKSQSCDVRQQGRSDMAGRFTFQQMRRSSTVPEWQKPILIGDFSRNREKDVIFDRSGLSFIKLDWDKVKVNFDLNAAIDKVIKKVPNPDGETINILHEYLSENSDKFRIHEDSSKNTGRIFPDFIGYRGLFRKIMCHAVQDWTFHATKYRGTIYFSEEEPEEHRTEDHQKSCTWGYKFEHYMTEGADPSTGHDLTVSYVCILRSKLGNHTMGYLAEVDGADRSLYDSSHKDLSAFVELKTSKLIKSDWERKKLIMYKTSKWWSQSFLVGIPRIICGYKDGNGIVTELETFKVDEMPKEAKKLKSIERNPRLANNFWNDDQMLFSLDELLSFVKTKVTDDNPDLVYEFVKRGQTVTCRCLGGKSSEKTVLHEWYIQKIENLVRAK